MNIHNITVNSTAGICAIFFVLLFGNCTQVDRLKAVIQKQFLEKSNSASERQAQTGSDKQKISYFEVKKSNLEDRVELRGKLLASERVEVRSDKRLRLGSSKVKVYDKVKKGQVLFSVDTKDFELKKTDAKERLEQLKIDLSASVAQVDYALKQNDRKQLLVKKGIAAKKELEDTEKQLIVAETSRKTKELDLRKAERELNLAQQTVATADILSPIDGVVANIISGGDEVGQGSVLAIIANPTTLSLYVNSDETLITKLPAGFEVEIKADSIPKNTFKGRVKGNSITAQADALIKSYETQVEVDPKIIASLNLKDGFEATMVAVFSKRESVFTVPLGAIKMNGTDAFVQAASSRGGSPSPRAVRVGLKTDLEAEILEGLRVGEYVALIAVAQENQ